MKGILRFLVLKINGRMQFLLRIYYSLIFASYGKNSIINSNVKVLRPENVYFGSNSSINIGCFLNAREKIQIGDNVHISPFTIINTGGLDYTRTSLNRNHVSKPVIINNGVWIGSGVIINPGVTIGENSVIGAGAVVTKDIPSNVVAVGVPAKIIKEIVRN